MFQIQLQRLACLTGVALLFAAFGCELFAARQICQQFGKVRCGTHPCTCETGSLTIGCQDGQYGLLDSNCTSSALTSCSYPSTDCGKVIVFSGVGTDKCSNCPPGGTLGTMSCTKQHLCSTP